MEKILDEATFHLCDFDSLYLILDWIQEEVERFEVPECGRVRITLTYIEEDESGATPASNVALSD